MCGRITQYRGRKAYSEAIGWGIADQNRWVGRRIPFYNVAPGTWPDMMHTLLEGEKRIDTVHWGYRPAWAIDKSLPEQINAQIETALSKPYYQDIMQTGRVIIPADGWYEWTGEPSREIPWYFRLQSGEPLFLAGITNWRPYTVPPAGAGFVILTREAHSDMAHIHPRRPVVLAAEDARIWLDNTTSASTAAKLAIAKAILPAAFKRYRVSQAVNTVGNNDESLIQPIAL